MSSEQMTTPGYYGADTATDARPAWGKRRTDRVHQGDSMTRARFLAPSLAARVSRSIRRTLSFFTVFALVGVMATATAAPAIGATPALSVTAYCYSNPERVVVRNNRTYAITIRTVGSIYQPRSNEPFYKTVKLYPGKSVTFYSGYAASSTSSRTLTRAYIFANNVGTTEGARVVATTGYARTDRC
jgi:hypothetical protein